MKNYIITQKENPNLYYASNDKYSQLIFRWEEDLNKADCFTFAEATDLIEKSITLQKIAELTERKINVDDLNGIGEQMVMKVITKTLQEYDPMKFSLKCEEEFTRINQEAMICYQVNTVPMQTPQGVLMIFIATWQYWGNESEYKAWETDLRRSKLLIKQ